VSQVITTQKFNDSCQLEISWQMIWDLKGVFNGDFLPHDVTVNA
jgi:hypothetical protein